jgi:mRNA interferase RelE/StbE
MLEVVYAATALKALKRIAKADAVSIMAKIDAHALDRSSGDVKRLKGSDLYRLRHGDYRAVFAVTATALEVRAVAHRREVYR